MLTLQEEGIRMSPKIKELAIGLVKVECGFKEIEGVRPRRPRVS